MKIMRKLFLLIVVIPALFNSGLSASGDNKKRVPFVGTAPGLAFETDSNKITLSWNPPFNYGIDIYFSDANYNILGIMKNYKDSVWFKNGLEPGKNYIVETVLVSNQGCRSSDATYNVISTKQTYKVDLFHLSPNYPNPFNPETSIRFNLPTNSEVDLYIYNALGQRIRTLVSARLSAGSHQIIWDGRNDLGQKVASGIYFYSIKAGDFSKTMKMIMTK